MSESRKCIDIALIFLSKIASVMGFVKGIKRGVEESWGFLKRYWVVPYNLFIGVLVMELQIKFLAIYWTFGVRSLKYLCFIVERYQTSIKQTRLNPITD